MPTRLTRRQFLAAPATLGVASLLPGGFAAALAQETPPLPDLSDWGRVRAQFSLDPAWMHFASFFIASHPAPVRDAIEAWRRAMDRDPFQVVEHGMFTDEAHNIPLQVRTAIAHYLGGKADDIALTRSTTESLALVYHGLPLKAGDEVLATTHDHYSHHESIRLATRRAGATTRRIALFEDAADATVDALTGRLLQALKPETRVVGLTWVHYATGIRLPIRDMARAMT
jgi:selenocysteine lyase/cysteine desulfurase